MNSKLKTIVLVLFGINNALANPQDGTVVSGNVTLQQNGNTLGINQTSDKAIIDWRQYNIAPNEQTLYTMPSASSVSLNRVTGLDPSNIQGKLTANGQIFLVNPNGILFGNNAQIDTAGLVATTHNIRNEDFLAGNYNFNIAGNPNASVINQGDIRIADTGIAAFVAPSVANYGVIAAKLGKVELAAANGFSLDFHGDNLLNFMVDDKIAQTAFDQNGKPLGSFVENAGRIQADGGYVLLTAKGAENAIHGVINQSGIIEATTVNTQKGTIILQAEKGDLNVSGTLNASAPNSGDGGFIETSGGKVKLDPNTKISTASTYGKTGQWLLDPTDYKIAASGGDITGAAVANFLNSTSVEIKTATTGTGNGDIFVNDGITWNNTNKLTFTAYRNINVNAPINANGGGSVKLRADSDGKNNGGTVNFNNTGHITANTGAVGIYYNPLAYNDSTTRSDSGYNPYSTDVTTASGQFTAYMLVNDVNQLQAILNNTNGNYALGKNIDANATSVWNSGAGFSPISSFNGIFDGGFQTISSLFINRPATNNVALFTSNSGTIKNIGLVNTNIKGNGNTGVLVASNTGKITDSYTTGSAYGGYGVGGLVGSNGGIINRSYSTVNVLALRDAGGLVSVNSGTISNSYATGSVTGTAGNYTALGSLVGVIAANSIISNSYATGKVSWPGGGLIAYKCVGWDCAAYTGSTTNSFWNTQTVGQADYYGFNLGTGLTTAQMKQRASFTGWWDFVNTWQINEGTSYPTLRTPTTPTTVTLTTVTPTPPNTIINVSGNPNSTPIPSNTTINVSGNPNSTPIPSSTTINVSGNPNSTPIPSNTTINVSDNTNSTEGQAQRNSDYITNYEPPTDRQVNNQTIVLTPEQLNLLQSLPNAISDITSNANMVSSRANLAIGNIPDYDITDGIKLKDYLLSNAKIRMNAAIWDGHLPLLENLENFHNDLPENIQERIDLSNDFDNASSIISDANGGRLGKKGTGELLWASLYDSGANLWDVIKLTPTIAKYEAKIFFAPATRTYEVYKTVRQSGETAVVAAEIAKNMPEIIDKVGGAVNNIYKLAETTYKCKDSCGNAERSEILNSISELGEFINLVNNSKDGYFVKSLGMSGKIIGLQESIASAKKGIETLNAIQKIPEGVIADGDRNLVNSIIERDAVDKAMDSILTAGKLLKVFFPKLEDIISYSSDAKDVIQVFRNTDNRGEMRRIEANKSKYDANSNAISNALALEIDALQNYNQQVDSIVNNSSSITVSGRF